MRLADEITSTRLKIDGGGPGSGRHPGSGTGKKDNVLRFHLKTKGVPENEMDKLYNTWHYELHERPLAENMVQRAKNAGFVATIKEVPRSAIGAYTKPGQSPYNQSGTVFPTTNDTKSGNLAQLRPMAASDWSLIGPPAEFTRRTKCK